MPMYSSSSTIQQTNKHTKMAFYANPDVLMKEQLLAKPLTDKITNITILIDDANHTVDTMRNLLTLIEQNATQFKSMDIERMNHHAKIIFDLDFIVSLISRCENLDRLVLRMLPTDVAHYILRNAPNDTLNEMLVDCVNPHHCVMFFFKEKCVYHPNQPLPDDYIALDDMLIKCINERRPEDFHPKIFREK